MPLRLLSDAIALATLIHVDGRQTAAIVELGQVLGHRGATQSLIGGVANKHAHLLERRYRLDPSAVVCAFGDQPLEAAVLIARFVALAFQPS